jgi:hypothetical protein
MKTIDSRCAFLLGFIGLSFLMLLLPLPAQAGAASESKEISWFFLAVGLLGGLSLFLYGMERMSDALKNVAGEKMKDILGMLSNNRFMGMITSDRDGRYSVQFGHHGYAGRFCNRRFDVAVSNHRRHYRIKHRHHHHGPDCGI